MKTIHIIGGEVAGCFLAYFLKGKYHIVIHEKNPHLGGFFHTFYNIENIPYQKGFNLLSTNQPWILSIMSKAGLKLSRIYHNISINPFLDFSNHQFPFTRESINSLPWHWKENIISDLNKVNGSFSSNLKDTIINFYGENLYEIFYKNFIKKLTHLDAENIDNTAWFKRYLMDLDNPAFYKEDCYFPIGGWNKLFDYLTQDVDIVFNDEITNKNISENDIIALTTSLNYFTENNNLPYVGLTFDIDTVKYLPSHPDTIIYPNDVSFLTISQYGKLYNTINENIIVKETTHLNKGEYTYPVITSDNLGIYASNVDNILHHYKHIYFCGSLATYKHMTMVETIEEAHKVSGEIKHLEG
jgi:UDP-galactopyranose mutase